MVEISDKKRYTVTLDFYLYANNDAEAKDKAKYIAAQFDSKYDNKCKVVEILEQPFGSLESRKI